MNRKTTARKIAKNVDGASISNDPHPESLIYDIEEEVIGVEGELTIPWGQDRFSKLEKSINRIEGHIGRIADKVLNGEIKSSRDSLKLGSAIAILRSGRIVNNGRNEETTDESNKSPKERNDEEIGVSVRGNNEGERIQIPDEVETPKADPSNNKLPSPSFPKVGQVGGLVPAWKASSCPPSNPPREPTLPYGDFIPSGRLAYARLMNPP
ncbi:hypothetical protein LWI29_014896 [Acer saccharum]|uniref:Uncharacterized protein n=1 Tax=Acer saccharum TaxID=4024 RepID=A0AA39RCZ5_ACESA|nr:hypothetical protein LWI29_014896 [Acer saccharum]